MFQFVPSHDGLREMLQSPEIMAALEDAAKQILPKAESEAEAAGLATYAASLRVETGTRPKGRTYARVIADDPSATAVEYGDDDTTRRRILGKAANVQINVRGTA